MSESNNGTHTPFTTSKLNEVLRRIAYKVGREEYGLNEEDFRITFFPWRAHAFRIRRLGSAVGVYFGVFPTSKEFLFYLKQALAAVKRALDGKPAIELASRLKTRQGELDKLNKDSGWASLPKLPPKEELVIEVTYRVTVRHKRTGVITVKDSKRPIINRLVLDARVEMAELLEVVERVEKKLP